MRRKEVIFVCVVAISTFLVVAESTANLTCTPPPKIEGTDPVSDDEPEFRLGEHYTYFCNYGSRNQVVIVCTLNETTGRTEWTVPETACNPSDEALIDDVGEQQILSTELPKKSSSVKALIDDIGEQQIPTTELQKKRSSDKAVIDDVGEQQIPATELPKKISNFTCTPPPEINGTEPLPYRPNEPAYKAGDHYTYFCNHGYVIRNSRNHVSTCIWNETTGKTEWTVPEITCVPRSCSDPGSVNNGRRIGHLFTFPNKVEYECEDGYKLVGMKARYCQAGGEWSGRLPTCEPILCGIPPSVVNGEVIYSSLEYGAELTYRCYPGYMATHKERRYCEEDGTWSGVAPECTEPRCTKPISPEFGKVNFNGEPKVGSIATYSCNPGLKLVGASTTKCLITGQWTFDAPQCLSFCTVPLVENGKMSKLSIRQTYNRRREETYTTLSEGDHVDHSTTLSFHCNEDFAIVDTEKIFKDLRVDVTCNNGKWSRDLHCRQTSCLGDPPTTENGEARINSRAHGYGIWYKCDASVVTKIPGNVTCHFGSWIGNPPQCLLSSSEQTRPVNVPPLPSKVEENSPQPSNHPVGNIKPSEQCNCTYVGVGYNVQAKVGNRNLKDNHKVRIGKTVSLGCKRGGMLTWQNGFRKYGNATMTCTTCRRWEVNDNPDCKLHPRGAPFIVLDDSVEIQPGGSVEVLMKKPITLRCVSSSDYPRWSFRGEPIRSLPYYQREVNEDFYFSIVNINEIGHDYVGLYRCYVNRPRLISEYTVVDVRVKENKCPLFAANKLVTYSNGNEIGSWATFTCPENTVLDGTSQIYCQNDGTWSSPEPFCRENKCPLLAGNKLVTYSNRNEIGSWATFSCPENTVLVGTPQIVCQNDGTWSSLEPSCRENKCPLFAGNKFVTYSNRNEIGSWATFSCPENTVLVGTPQIVCQYDRTWSSTEPYCRERCSIGDLSISVKQGVVPDSRFVTEEYVPYGSTVPLTCEGKFIPEGNSTAVCGEQGRWKIGKFECVLAGCRLKIEPSSSLRAEPLKDSYRLGEAVTLSCSDGEKTTNDVVRLMCMGQLGWSDTIPDCIKS